MSDEDNNEGIESPISPQSKGNHTASIPIKEEQVVSPKKKVTKKSTTKKAVVKKSASKKTKESMPVLNRVVQVTPEPVKSLPMPGSGVGIAIRTRAQVTSKRMSTNVGITMKSTSSGMADYY